MNEQRDRALARTLLERNEKEKDLFETLLAAGRDKLSPDYIEATEYKIEGLEQAIGRANERLQKYMHRIYCRWRSVGTVYGGHEFEFQYTLDKDGDGWYWWRIRKSERYDNAPIPMSKVLEEIEGKKRKKKDAKAAAEREYKKRYGMVVRARKAREEFKRKNTQQGIYKETEDAN